MRQRTTSNLEIGVFAFDDTRLSNRAIGGYEFAGLGQVVVNAGRVDSLDDGLFAKGHRQRIGDGTEGLHGTVTMGCIDGVLGVACFLKDGEEVIELIRWHHVEGGANGCFKLTCCLVDLLHEAVLSEVLDEALVAVKDGRDVFVAGFELHHGIGQNTTEGLHLPLLLPTLLVDGSSDEEGHQNDGKSDEVARREQAIGATQGFCLLVGDFVRDVVL